MCTSARSGLGGCPVSGHVCVAEGKYAVEPALLALDLCEQAIEIAEIRHVSLHAGDIAPDVLNRGGQLSIAAPGYKDVDSFVHGLLRARQADAAIAAGDERNLSFELAHGGIFSRFSGDLHNRSPALPVERHFCPPVDKSVYAPT